ncbi:cyanopeptolin synthetase, partial [Candidatus Thiomargarita nelsonii]
GFRIELGEIEAVLSQHPAVQENTVIVREDTPSLKRLVAYVVPTLEQTPTISELRRFLKEKLPDYMVPSALVLLDALPLMPNGKIDRRALPVPEQLSQEQKETFVAPRETLEQQLAQIWEKVLKIHPIGVHDNFFDIGGNSMLAMTLLSRIEKHLGKSLSLVVICRLFV